jgi:hypothetical protein
MKDDSCFTVKATKGGRTGSSVAELIFVNHLLVAFCIAQHHDTTKWRAAISATNPDEGPMKHAGWITGGPLGLPAPASRNAHPAWRARPVAGSLVNEGAA